VTCLHWLYWLRMAWAISLVIGTRGRDDSLIRCRIAISIGLMAEAGQG